jgi:hypothetical protein
MTHMYVYICLCVWGIFQLAAEERAERAPPNKVQLAYYSISSRLLVDYE